MMTNEVPWGLKVPEHRLMRNSKLRLAGQSQSQIETWQQQTKACFTTQKLSIQIDNPINSSIYSPLYTMMSYNHAQKIKIELAFILLSVIIAGLIVLPIINAGIKFDLLVYNFIYVMVALTFIRWLVRWDLHPLSDSKVGKVLIIFMTPILFFPLLEGIHSFIEFKDQAGLESIMTHLSHKKQQWYSAYMRNEYLFFAVGSFITSILLIFKMLRSIWRQYKYADKNKLKEG